MKSRSRFQRDSLALSRFPFFDRIRFGGNHQELTSDYLVD